MKYFLKIASMERVPLKIVFILLFVLSLDRSAAAQSSDWPRWLGENSYGIWDDEGILEKFPESGPKILWRANVGVGYAGPAVADGKVFVMDRFDVDEKGDLKPMNPMSRTSPKGVERLVCLNAKTGEILWKHQYDCPYKIQYPAGPRCTPTVDGDRVYFLGAMGDLHCVKASDGEIVWKKQLLKDYSVKPPLWGYASHPLIHKNDLIVPVGGEGSAVVALDKLTGKEKWKAVSTSDIAYVPLTLFKPDSEEPQLIFWHADGVHSLNPNDGQVYWNVKWPDKKQQDAGTTIATPRVYSGNHLYFTEFYAGSLQLRIGSNPPSVEEIDRSKTSDPKKEFSIDSLMTTPIVKDHYVYGVTGKGAFRCADLESQELQWEKTDWLDGKKRPTLFASCFMVQNQDRFFIFTDQGELIIARVDPEQFEEIGRAKILEPTGAARGRSVLWSHPAFAGGNMFARNDKEMVCVDLRAEQKTETKTKDE